MKRGGKPIEVPYGCLFLAYDEWSYVQHFITKLSDLADGDVQVTKMRVMHQPAR